MRRAIVLIAVALALVQGAAGVTVTVAMWAGEGAAENCVERSLEAINYWNQSPDGARFSINVIPYYSSADWRYVLETGRDPQTGQRIDVIYVPGGFHPEWHWDFDWVSALYHAQIDLGIGYVGVCAGAYLHAGVTSRGGIGEDVFVDGVTAIDGNRGEGEVPVLLYENPLTPPSTWGRVFQYVYANGPGLGPESGSVIVSDREWYERVSLDGREIKVTVQGVGQYLSTVEGWAIVLGQYYLRSGNGWVPRGRFVLFGVHPELTDRVGAWKFLARSLIWAAGYEPLERCVSTGSSSGASELPVIAPIPVPRSRRTPRAS
ncbi:hypothetical protein [Methanopyrus sp.]